MSLHGTGPISLNWNLDLHARAVIDVSASLLATALVDNVQVLAVTVCESYGANLPICRDTCDKMESLARRAKSWEIFKQVGVKIGFSQHDVVYELSRSDAGIRFLGLASALLSLGSPYEAAKALHLFLDDSSPKNQLIPTVQQLKDLFVVLEHKISASDFVNSLQGWDIILKSSEVGLQDLFIDLVHIQEEDRPATPGPEGGSHHLPDNSPLPPREVSCVARSTELSGLGISIAPLPQVRQTGVQGAFVRSCCPPEVSIMKLLQALAELGRVGEATSAIIQVPPEVAAWCIAFVKWCLGTPPSIRQLKKDGTYKQAALLEQPCSNVFLDIAEPGSKDFYVRTFRKMSRIEDLLWESHIEVSGAMPWAGLLSPKMYFQGRIRDLQSRHNLLHVINTLLVLAREVPKAAEQFPPPDDIVDLVAMLFDIDNVTAQLKKVETSEILEFWSRKKPQTLILQLFVEVLMLSLVENIKHENCDIFIATQENRPSLTRHPFITPLGRWLRKDSGFDNLQLPMLRTSEICHDVLALLGVDQICVDGSNPLISSHRGQVAYPSFLETLKLNPRCPLSYRVHQGRLQYEGLYYAYATGDNGTHLAGLLKETPGKSITSSSPLPFQPIPRKAPSNIAESHQWLCSKQDNYLAIYFKPYLHGDYTLDPRHFITACETTTILQECQRDCHTLEAPDEEIHYCSDIASVFSCRSIRLLRVLTCQSPIDTLFIQVAWTDIWADEERISDMEREKVILVAKGQSCLHCACRAALEILKEKFSGHDLEQARAVVIV